MERQTQNSTELEQWWKSGTHGFRRRHEFAAAVGVSYATIYNWFRGKMNPAHHYRKVLFEITRLPCFGPRQVFAQELHSEDPGIANGLRQVFAQELQHWWETANHGFRLWQDLAHRVGITPGMLSSYFAGRTFPTLPICEKLYAVTKLPILEPRKAAETIDALQSEAARKRHTPAVSAKISEALKADWAANPRPTAYLHTPEVEAKAQAAAKTPEAKKRHSEGIKASFAPERRKHYSKNKKQWWERRKAEIAHLRQLAAAPTKLAPTHRARGIAEDTQKRIQLAAASSILGHSKRQMSALLFPRSNDPVDDTKKLFRRRAQLIEDAKKDLTTKTAAAIIRQSIRS